MTTKQQIPKIASSLVEFQDYFSSLSMEDGQWVIQNTKRAITLFVSAVSNRKKGVFDDGLYSTFNVPASTKKFIVKNKFHHDGFNLGIYFLRGYINKIEAPFSGSVINGKKLNENYYDEPIVKELGGEEKAETTLYEVYSLIKKQLNGEIGCLHTNGLANIFYVKDSNGDLQVLQVFRRNHKWNLEAFQMNTPIKWRSVYRIFFRNSSCFQ